jgi:predicted GNAT family N-acyltransferase
MSLRVEKICNQEDLKVAFEIRHRVFVIEQQVEGYKEQDEFEENATHFIVSSEENPVGTARWRFTSNGIKLERFAVLPEARGKGAGQALVRAVLEDITANAKTAGMTKYLHAQLSAVPLYSKFGFEKVGEIFEECNILHSKMELN